MSFGKFSDSSDTDKDMKASSNTDKVRPLKAVSGSSSGKAFLGSGSKVVGKLNFDGPVELDGEIEGEIEAADSLKIGEEAVINAKITGTEVTVYGTVNGDISASKKLSLCKPAKITGNIRCTSLTIEEGVVFEGNCSMDKLGKPGSFSVNG